MSLPASLVTPPPARQRHRTPATPNIVGRYLDRLGVACSPPSIDALHALHRAHVERVPYETFWLHLREGWGIDPHESLRRITGQRRGGYCFHLNGAFAELLEWLGYHVTRHAAGVHDNNGPTPTAVGNHLALTVDGLPDDANPGGRWYVDVGLGDALHSPLPLRPGTYQQGPMTFTISTGDGVGDWSLGNDTAGSFAGITVVAAPVALDTLQARHVYNATSPNSSFARTVTAQRRHAGGVEIMRGCVLTTRGAFTSMRTFEHRSDWLAALDDHFGIRLPVSRVAIERLWAGVRDAHSTWLATAEREVVR